jgi:transcriptional regulator with XRE-family HTH domain
MSDIGQTARLVRKRLGLTQRAAADALCVSVVHLSNVERGRAVPSSSLISRFNKVYKIDVYVLAFCLDDADDDPASLRKARRTLANAMQQLLGEEANAG